MGVILSRIFICFKLLELVNDTGSIIPPANVTIDRRNDRRENGLLVEISDSFLSKVTGVKSQIESL